MCVSCYNRQGEIEKGRNARGNAPIKLLEHKPVPHSITFVHAGELVRFDRNAVDSFEPMLAAVFMAKSPETIRFVFGRPDLEQVGNGPAPDWQRNRVKEATEHYAQRFTLKGGELGGETCGTN
ncbi:hypothetical protein [Methylocaldum sp.]|uniref:hypothetical protein n=1 Tax=Methylocaldum sp. TaxID=1969727 RepID=UPI002D5AAB4F|nr:hypothetical protein [Methylocaldum sp.]HYE36131.1 hypothetical protein [Methylocaldum sp.]